MRDIVISIEEQSKLFQKHLEEPDNERIIFSAAFGTGKTYFLRKFFIENENKYLTIKLAPVNYSIASNEDIFRLIKFDILFELLAHHNIKQPGKIKISPDIFYGLKLAEKADTFFTSIVAFLGTLNKDTKETTEVITALATIRSQVEEFIGTSTEIPENQAINEFLQQMLEVYFHEADDITAFIETALSQLANSEDKAITKKILIIDDLDRLDPEHIFRLFNVFSAHFDYNKSTRNKFGFDTVIFVCDIRNIRNIFQSRYGESTDFSGYIDKFFSQEVFFFNNEQAIKVYVDDLLKSIRLESKDEFIKDYFTTNIIQGANYKEKGLSFWILLELIVSGSLKPRRIYSPHKAWVYPDRKIVSRFSDGSSRTAHLNCVPTIVALQLLSTIAGGGEQLLSAVKHAAGQPRSEDYMSNSERAGFIERLTGKLLIIDYHNHKFQSTDNSNRQSMLHRFRLPDGRELSYIIGRDDSSRQIYDSRIETNPSEITFFDLLPIMIQKMLTDKLI